MFGKHFASMYEGSMFGAGPVVFAVWGYVIAKAYKSAVELNPKLLAAILGCTEAEVEKAIDFLCKPDPNSRNKEHGGRRLVKEGAFQYLVPSWEIYRNIVDYESRKEYNRRKQAEYREKQKIPRNVPTADEAAYLVAEKNGTLCEGCRHYPCQCERKTE